jgi:hypothetical protein
VWEIEIYRKTIVPLGLPLLLWVGTGLVLTPFLKDFLKRHYDTDSLLLQSVFNIVTWGGFTVFLFMWSNFTFTKDEVRTVKLIIQNRGTLAEGRYGCGNPYVDVTYMGKEKQLVFPCNTDVTSYEFAYVLMKEGAFGYPIIVQQQLEVN